MGEGKWTHLRKQKQKMRHNMIQEFEREFYDEESADYGSKQKKDSK